MSTARIAVIGAGITGCAAAFELATAVDRGLDAEIVVFDPDPPGGRLRSSPFAGLDALDEGADAFLQRVPDAVGLATEVGLGDDLVHPEPVGAAVWYDRLHRIPDGLVLGVPGDLLALSRTRLLSARGKLRAAVEPLLPRRPVPGVPDDGRDAAADSIGQLVRARFGHEVHERIVDSLVGSIYAADTDRFSLAEVPQLAALAEHRSLLLGARRIAGSRPAGTATASAAPIFGAPRGGMADLARASLHRSVEIGGTVVRAHPAHVESIGPDAVVVDGERFDRAVLALPASAAADLLDRAVTTSSGDAAAAVHGLRRAETADVAMITLHVDATRWPDRLRGLSGYLVPKPVQRHVTAASFASQKWAHWRPPGGGEILRVSAGRDGAPVLHLDDDAIVDRALDDLTSHLGAAVDPLAVRLSRWPGAFAQYRPHHRRWVDDLRASLPPTVRIAGSSYDGIGVPACVRSGRSEAARAIAGLAVG